MEKPGSIYLCSGFKAFFHHVDRPMKLMVDLMSKGQYASGVMAILDGEKQSFRDEVSRTGRNDPCPCGSGLKLKRCHGLATETEPETRPLPQTTGSPRTPVTLRGRMAVLARETRAETDSDRE